MTIQSNIIPGDQFAQMLKGEGKTYADVRHIVKLHLRIKKKVRGIRTPMIDMDEWNKIKNRA